MCCRRQANPGLPRLLGIEEELPHFSKVYEDDDVIRIEPPASSGSRAAKSLCCLCAALAALGGALGGACLAPRGVSGQLSGLRLTDIKLPNPGGNASDLTLEYQGILSVQNPNMIGVSIRSSLLAISYGDMFLGSTQIQDMYIDSQSSSTIHLQIALASIPANVGEAMMLDMAASNGLLRVVAKATVVADFFRLKLSALGRELAFRTDLIAGCSLTSDVQKLPEIADRRCDTTSTLGYELLDL